MLTGVGIAQRVPALDLRILARCVGTTNYQHHARTAGVLDTAERLACSIPQASPLVAISVPCFPPPKSKLPKLNSTPRLRSQSAASPDFVVRTPSRSRDCCCPLMRTRRPTPADLPALAALLSTNECLCILGRAQAQPEWVTIGEAYVANVLRTEYASFEKCMARYASPASRLWVLVDESDAVLGSVGVIEDPQQSTGHMELVRMYMCSPRHT